MNLLFRTLLTCLCLIVPGLARTAEKLSITNYTVHDGLSQNTVRSMMQDSQGFLWFGTSNGLNRYDGHHFHIIQPGDGGNALDRRFNYIMQDRSGYVWLLTQSGSCYCYDPVTERIRNCFGNSGKARFKNMLVTDGGSVWLWGDGGCAMVSRRNDNTFRIWRPGQTALASGRINKVYEDSRHGIWIATDGGLFRMDGGKAVLVDRRSCNISESGGFLYFGSDDRILVYDQSRGRFAPPATLPRRYAGKPTRQSLLPEQDLLLVFTEHAILYYDTRKRTWAEDADAIGRRLFGGNTPERAYPIYYGESEACIANYTGNIWIYNKDSRSFDIVPVVENAGKMVTERYRILQYDKDNYWITSQHNGITHYNQEQRSIQRYNTTNQLPSNDIRGIIKDRAGDIWVSTIDHGVLHIRQGYRYYQRISPMPAADKSLNNIRMTFVDRDGRWWLGTKSDVKLVYVTGPDRQTPEHILELPGGSAYCITELPSGEKLIGTKPGGIYRISADGSKITEHILLSVAGNRAADNVYQMVIDHRGRLWVATYGGGVFMLAEENGRFVIRNHFTFDYAPYNNMVRCIVHDRQGNILVGTNDGIIMFNADGILKDRKAYRRFTIKQSGNGPDTDVDVKTLLIDRNGTLWVGTGGLGIYYAGMDRIKEGKAGFRHLGTTGQSRNVIIQALAEDRYGNVWATAEDYVIRIDRNYRKDPDNSYNSLPTNDAPIYNETAACTTPDGKVMFGSNNGIYLVDTNQQTEKRHPHVLLSALKIQGEYVYPGAGSPLTKSITLTDELCLTHLQNTLTLEFAMDDYRSFDSNGYYYSFEKDGNTAANWMQTGQSNEITFHNLQPGKYCLRVKSDIDSPASSERLLTIVILPPWWRTWWAYLIYVVVLTAAGYTAYRHAKNIMKMRAENAAERSLSEYKMKFFSRVSHDLRTPLTIIQGSLESLPQNEEHTQFILSKSQIAMLNRNADRLLTLIDKVLAFQDCHSETAIRQHMEESVREAEKLLSPEEKGEDGSVEQKSEQQDMTGYRILIVDDNEDMLKMLHDLLSKTFSVSTAKNGTEAISLLSEVQPDLIVCDVMMPKMDGFEFTRRVRSDFNVSHIPVILLTATVSDEARLKGIEMGADAYITKPFSKNYLMARIVGLIDQRQKLQRKYATEPTPTTPFISATERDKQFIDRVNEIISQNIGNFDFKIDDYAAEFHVGRTTFFAKTKSIIGYTPYEYVRMTRMKRAAEMLRTTDMNVSEICYKVGINDPYSFSRSFKQTFGKSPTQYRKDICGESGKQ